MRRARPCHERSAHRPAAGASTLRGERLDPVPVGELGARVEHHLLSSLETGEHLHPAAIVLAGLDPDQPDPVLGVELRDVDRIAPPGERVAGDERRAPSGEANLHVDVAARVEPHRLVGHVDLHQHGAGARVDALGGAGDLRLDGVARVVGQAMLTGASGMDVRRVVLADVDLDAHRPHVREVEERLHRLVRRGARGDQRTRGRRTGR